MQSFLINHNFPNLLFFLTGLQYARHAFPCEHYRHHRHRRLTVRNGVGLAYDVGIMEQGLKARIIYKPFLTLQSEMTGSQYTS